MTINVDEPNEIKAYFSNMEKPSDLSYSEYLRIAHDINALNKSEDKGKDCGIVLIIMYYNYFLMILQTSDYLEQKMIR